MRACRSLAWSTCSCSTIRSVLRSFSSRLNVGDRAAQLDDLVGEQPGPGVAHDRRDGLRLAGDLGLVTERLQLAADLAGEVVQPGQVGLHRLELAERLLLATAVLRGCRRPPR